jgi:hypothetical protein
MSAKSLAVAAPWAMRTRSRVESSNSRNTAWPDARPPECLGGQSQRSSGSNSKSRWLRAPGQRRLPPAIYVARRSFVGRPKAPQGGRIARGTIAHYG